MTRRAIPFLVVVCLAFLASSPAEGGGTRAEACGVSAYAYAGVESNTIAHGVSADLTPTKDPSIAQGHTGGWVGLGGPTSGPGGVAEWLQAGYAAIPFDQSNEMYYEVTVAGQQPRYVQLAPNVPAGEVHRIAVLEMSGRDDWWRVWVDYKPVSPPIHLPGSHDAWYPQAVAENWNGNQGACNSYGYRFANVALATADGGSWRPLVKSYTYQDPGYKVVPISTAPRDFLATSLA